MCTNARLSLSLSLSLSLECVKNNKKKERIDYCWAKKRGQKKEGKKRGRVFSPLSLSLFFCVRFFQKKTKKRRAKEDTIVTTTTLLLHTQTILYAEEEEEEEEWSKTPKSDSASITLRVRMRPTRYNNRRPRRRRRRNTASQKKSGEAVRLERELEGRLVRNVSDSLPRDSS